MAYQMNRADVLTLNERRQIFGMDDRTSSCWILKKAVVNTLHTHWCN